jgi:hypothetical protein
VIGRLTAADISISEYLVGGAVGGNRGRCTRQSCIWADSLIKRTGSNIENRRALPCDAHFY